MIFSKFQTAEVGFDFLWFDGKMIIHDKSAIYQNDEKYLQKNHQKIWSIQKKGLTLHCF